jgi:cyclin-dependent kinase 7
MADTSTNVKWHFAMSCVTQVLEFMDSDLEAVIKDRSLVLGPADVKGYFQQLLRGLAACHAHYVVHRDVKVR